MHYKQVRLESDIYDALMDLKYDYREKSLSDTLAHLLHELGVEPFDEDEYDNKEE